MWINDAKSVPFDALVGKTLTKIVVEDPWIIKFFASDGSAYMMHHLQACCEDVRIDDICGDLDDLIGSPILSAKESTNSDLPPKYENDESYIWTFYLISTIKGSVTLRWYGESNGYYSESVDFELLPPNAMKE